MKLQCLLLLSGRPTLETHSKFPLRNRRDLKCFHMEKKMLASGLQTERGFLGKMRHFIPCKEWGQPGVTLYSEDCRRGICRQPRKPGGT